MVLRHQVGFSVLDPPWTMAMMGIKLRVVGVGEKEAVLDLDVRSVDVGNAQEVSTDSANQMRNLLTESFLGFKREVRLALTGEVETGPPFKTLTRMLGRAMGMSLPVTPVGVGARWQTTSLVDYNGSFLATTCFELVSMDGDTIDIHFTSDGRPAEPHVPRIRKGGQIVHRMDTVLTASGRIVRDLRAPSPSIFHEKARIDEVDLIKSGEKSRQQKSWRTEELWASADGSSSSQPRKRDS